MNGEPRVGVVVPAGPSEKVVREIQRQARKQLIAEVRSWATAGQSVERLVFRLSTIHLEYVPKVGK